MKKLKSFIILYMCFCLCLSLVSCGENDYFDESIVYTTVDSVSTFDPQLCKTPAEISIATNSFEGLMTKDENGNVVKGMAESYTVSDDKKTYTFKIREGMMWSNGETEVSAKDFEFGFERAVLKDTESPYVSSIYCIKNAEKINKGKADMSTLGVSANGDYLTIVLEKADEGFLETLTYPMCFPCNEEYFYSTSGKYGRSNKYIISNGAYSINYYNTDTKTAIIQRNDDYVGEFGGIPAQITINYGEKQEDIYSYFEAKEIDIGSVDCSYLASLSEMGFKSELYYNTNYCLYMSKKLVSSSGSDLKRALSLDIDSGSLDKNVSDYYGVVKGIIPSVNMLGGFVYRNEVGDVKKPEYNPQKAKSLLGNFDNATDMLNGLYLYYPSENEKLSLISNLIVQGWQKDLNVYINSKPQSEETIVSDVTSGEILIAIIPISSKNNSAISSYNTLKEYGIVSEIVIDDSASELFEKEQSLVDSGVIYPILSIPNAVAYAENISGFSATDDGKIIDFRFIKKD